MTTIYLVSCVGQKLDHAAPAKDLYVSDWFRKARAYVEWVLAYFENQKAKGEMAWDADEVERVWGTGPVTREGLGKYLIAGRAPGDPERTPRELRVDRDLTARWRRELMKTPASELRGPIYQHLLDGEPRTLNRIGVEMIDKTGDNVMSTPFAEALLGLVSDYLVEFHYVDEKPKHILFRARKPSEDDGWFILSAKYGLVDPDEVIEPYELTLKQMTKAERKEWAEEVFDELMYHLAEDDEVVIFAGEYYREFLFDWLLDAGMIVYTPLAHLGIGQQKRWFKTKGKMD